ncbi:hypothetical protein LOTGIDRAFT_234656 [Lottia gigantea]|uniref:Alpha/beta hydrolase fold-3 domain-containing protein n=1 Tax=Lottia gigantea TaxID=225164 RepID=V4A553_LOTGI|nr:hypothetical protein LOTGIDRAFT_234656 [Lottia gigantea]ESO88361.1 hypothetical protein LOTGIDRAFT_234656 [Lottia gigantea]
MSNEEEHTLIRDIFYSGKDTDEDVDPADANKECLDLYLPAGVHFERCNDTENGPLRPSSKNRANPDQKVPFVIFVHGGGWRRGDRQVWQHFLSCWDTNIFLAMVSWYYGWYSNVGECLANSGIACAVVSYPLVTINIAIILWEKMTSFLGGVCMSCVLSGIVMFLYGNPSISSVLWTGLLSYSVFIMVLMFVRTVSYRMNAGRRNLLWLIFGGVSFVIWAATDDYLYYISIFSTIYTQSILISKKIILPPVTHADQIKAVKSAIGWCNALCDKSDYFSDIILMGHSAGGHLVSLVSLEPQNHCQRVKGVISISGVYDLQKLATGLLKYVYLHPIFGTDPSFWLAYSPRHIAKCQADYKRPPYLLVNADQDMHLIKDAKDLSETFNEHNISHRLMYILNPSQRLETNAVKKITLNGDDHWKGDGGLQTFIMKCHSSQMHQIPIKLEKSQ